MNKQSNSYTILYAVGLVLVVGLVLSAIYQSLRPQQQENIDNDTRTQILKAALLPVPEGSSVGDFFNDHVQTSYLVNYNGAIVDKNPETAFEATLNIAQESKKKENERKLPVFECSTDQGLKYIVPVYGQGLWGPIWGYVAFNADGSTIYGAYFAHKGETPGLGAEIEKPEFSGQFHDKKIFSHGTFEPIMVVKAGKEPAGKEWVHSVSGATITSSGVQKMLEQSLIPYEKFLDNLRTEAGKADSPADKNK